MCQFDCTFSSIVSQCGDTALHFACREDRMVVVQLLLRAGADIEAKDRVRACSAAMTKIMIMLLEGYNCPFVS